MENSQSVAVRYRKPSEENRLESQRNILALVSVILLAVLIVTVVLSRSAISEARSETQSIMHSVLMKETGQSPYFSED